jgi:hypothetical protein
MPIDNIHQLLDETKKMNQLLDEIQQAKRLLEQGMRADTVVELIKKTRPDKDE